MPTLRAQQRVGSFILLERLGAGGAGEVWKARDRRLNRVVALKFIAAGGADPRRVARDLTREGRAASALSHPNIVTILEIGKSESGAFIAMEFVEGETLRALMDRARVPLQVALDIVRQVAKGLARAHQSGIVHGDVKPENVMLRIDGAVKLVDFGLAQTLPWHDENSPVTDSDVGPRTADTARLAGSFGYMSPEQARCRPIDPASDIFSFGIVLYELFTGEHPFKADNPIDTLHRIIHDEPAGTRVRCPELPQEIHSIVQRCLKKDATQRFGSAVDLEAHLRLAHDAPMSTRRPKWKSYMAAALLAVLLGILILMWNPFFMRSGEQVTVRSIAVMNFKVGPESPIAGILVQGLSEELAGSLAQEGFRVTPSSRVLAVAIGTDARSVGSLLGVDAVVEGNVANLNDNSIRIHIELIETRTGYQIWNKSLITRSTDLLSSDFATEIARQLRAATGPGR